MANPNRRQRLNSSFNIGGESAESDPLLDRAFFRTNQFEVARSRESFDCFVIGRTGSGKSAILRTLEEEHPKHVVRIDPEAISLPYIAAIDIFRYLDSLDVNLDLLWIALWKHVILIEVIKHRYNVDSPDARKNFVETLRSAVSRDSAKKLALDYLEEFDGKFWAESDERVRQITDAMEKKIAGELKGTGVFPGFTTSGSVARETKLTHEEKQDLAARYQSIVNDTQLARLNKLIEILNDNILDSDQNFVYVIIDDLDRDWVDDRLSNALMRCLLRAVMDFQRVRNLKVLVALRTNIYENIDFGRKGAGQEEKIRALEIRVTWDRKGLASLLDERVRVASAANDGNTQKALELLPHPNATRGNPMEYILDRTLLRPRDAISFFKECIRQADGKAQISWENILQAEKVYSFNRFLALRDEWKGTYPGVGLLFEAFRGSAARMSRENVAECIDNAILTLSDSDAAGADWFRAISEPVLSGRADLGWEGTYQPAVALLYRLGFLAASLQPSDKPIFFLEDPHLVSSVEHIMRVRGFVVTRPYQSALAVRIGAN